MIVCSCNVFSDHDVRNAVIDAKSLPPRTAGQVYGCLGCSPQCGRCARTIKQIMDDALGPCAKGCCAGCPHSGHAEDESQIHASDVDGNLEDLGSARYLLDEAIA